MYLQYSITLSPLSCLLYHVCLLSLVFCLPSPVSRLLSHVSCLMSPVSCLLSHVSCLTSPVSRLLSRIFCLTYPVSRLTYHVSHLMIMSLVSCLLSHILSLTSRHVPVSCLMFLSHIFYLMSQNLF